VNLPIGEATPKTANSVLPAALLSFAWARQRCKRLRAADPISFVCISGIFSR
jgi:hypothetical protein